jgi:hypothetical protein
MPNVNVALCVVLDDLDPFLEFSIVTFFSTSQSGGSVCCFAMGFQPLIFYGESIFPQKIFGLPIFRFSMGHGLQGDLQKVLLWQLPIVHSC